MAEEVDGTADQQTQEGAEQSTTDQAAQEGSGVEAGGQTDDSGSADEVELLSQEEFDALKEDPAAFRKAMNRAATRKFQEISTQRKALEPYTEFIQALNEDPRAAITAVAQRLGLEIKGAEQKTAEQIAKQAGDEITTQVKQALGPEYEDLAERLIPAIKAVAQNVASEIAKPLVQQQEDIIRDSAMRESKAAIEVFAKANPGWQKHEAAMLALSKKLPPGEGMTEGEYLNTLYYLVTRDAQEGDAAKKIASRISANAATAETRRQPVPAARVGTPSKPLSFQEAYQMAKRGEQIER